MLLIKPFRSGSIMRLLYSTKFRVHCKIINDVLALSRVSPALLPRVQNIVPPWVEPEVQPSIQSSAKRSIFLWKYQQAQPCLDFSALGWTRRCALCTAVGSAQGSVLCTSLGSVQIFALCTALSYAQCSAACRAPNHQLLIERIADLVFSLRQWNPFWDCTELRHTPRLNFVFELNCQTASLMTHNELYAEKRLDSHRLKVMPFCLLGSLQLQNYYIKLVWPFIFKN